MDELDRLIINELQGDLPVCGRPYLAAATLLGIGEDELIARLASLLERRILTRVGPLFQIERMGGAFTLAALHAPPERYDAVADILGAMPQVAHNYAREHHLNMWFVLATEKPEEIQVVIDRIARETDCEVFNFPKSREYFVEMKLQA
jgi:siroheme decarboxylase